MRLKMNNMDKYPPTLIEISHGDAEASVKLPWDADIHQIMHAFRGMLVTIGFADNQVVSAMSEMVDENRRDEKDFDNIL